MRKQSFLLHSHVMVVHPQFENLTDFISSIPARFASGEGSVIYKGRNELRLMEHEGHAFVVKSFHQPNIINRIAYVFCRSSKAERSYEHARMLQEIGVSTPQPIGYLDTRRGLLFDSSYYICRKSDCKHVYEELFYQKFNYTEQVLRAIGRMTANLHEHGFAHLDYGRGNILFYQTEDGSIKLDIVDLNRMYIGTIGMKAGCKNFERLPATPQMHRWLAEEYAQARGFDVDNCYKLMLTYRKTQPWKIEGKY